MELTVTLIRNGITQSGIAGNLLGIADEPIAAEGTEQLLQRINRQEYPAASLVYTSGLLRCRKTAELIYPYTTTILLRELRAFDLGDFEGKTYGDAIRDKPFMQWASAQELLLCPNGESPYELSARSILAFRSIADEMTSKGIENTAVITHKMVIRAIMQRFCAPRSYYLNWDVQYGGGYTLLYNTSINTAKIIARF